MDGSTLVAIGSSAAAAVGSVIQFARWLGNRQERRQARFYSRLEAYADDLERQVAVERARRDEADSAADKYRKLYREERTERERVEDERSKLKRKLDQSNHGEQ